MRALRLYQMSDWVLGYERVMRAKRVENARHVEGSCLSQLPMVMQKARCLLEACAPTMGTRDLSRSRPNIRAASRLLATLPPHKLTPSPLRSSSCAPSARMPPILDGHFARRYTAYCCPLTKECRCEIASHETRTPRFAPHVDFEITGGASFVYREPQFLDGLLPDVFARLDVRGRRFDDSVLGAQQRNRRSRSAHS